MSEFVSFEDYLDKYGTLVYTNVGTSMLPLIRQGRDAMVIGKRPEVLKQYDVVLYHLNGRYVLHRLIGGSKAKGYVIRGDNCEVAEVGIPDSAVIGVLKAVIRDGAGGGSHRIEVDSEEFRRYTRYIIRRYPFWRIYRKARHFVGRVLRKLGLRK